MVTMYKKDRKYRKWKWTISPSRFFDVFTVDTDGARHYVFTYTKRDRAQARKEQLEADGNTAIIIGRA